jgi:hypothetical protein
VNLLDFSDMWGERLTLFDLKLGKNFRFGHRRVNIHVFNLFNSDAIDNYNDDYAIDNPGNAGDRAEQLGYRHQPRVASVHAIEHPVRLLMHG